MPTPILSKALLPALFFATALPGLRATTPDSFLLDMSPAAWTCGPEMTASQDGTRLLLSSSTQSAWASPAGRWPSSSQLEFRMEGAAEGGRLIAQAEWFDRSGQFVKAVEITSLSGPDIQSHGGSIPVPDGGSSFGLKFWLEGIPAKGTIASIRIQRTPDWPTPPSDPRRIDPDNTKLEADSGLTVSKSSSSWEMRLAEGTPYAAVHLHSPVEARPGMRVLLPVLETPPGGMVSMQILRWGSGMTFIDQVDALKDLSEAGDYEFQIPEGAASGGAMPSAFTAKIWVNAPPGKTVRVGAPVFSGPPATP